MRCLYEETSAKNASLGIALKNVESLRLPKIHSGCNIFLSSIELLKFANLILFCSPLLNTLINIMYQILSNKYY